MYFRDVIIKNGESLSSQLELVDHAPLKIYLPSGWTGANLTVVGTPAEKHEINPTWYNLFNSDGTEFSASGGDASGARVIDQEPLVYYGLKQIRFRSGTAAAPVNQVGHRVIRIAMVEIE